MKHTGFSVLLLLSAPALVSAQEVKFMRLAEENGKPAALEIAITRYTNPSKTVTVDLVGVVHIGDRAYYDRLNKRLADYDAVLYELVAPPGTRVPKGGGKGGGISNLITGLMSSMLQLDTQLACVDYHKKNFVHADLSFDAMLEAAKARGESGLSLGLAVLADMFKQAKAPDKKKEPTADDDIDIAAALFKPNLLKRQLARQMLDSMELGPTLQTLLVADRNKQACAVLTDEITAGKVRIAIFYGAAHMPDFERRLRREFGLRRVSQEWLTAWNLR